MHCVGEYPAVTITLAKRKGTDATVINEESRKDRSANCEDTCFRQT